MTALPEIHEIRAGDARNIDEYVQNLNEQGIAATYENIYSDSMSWMAEVYIKGEKHAVWEYGVGGEMVKQVVRPLTELIEVEP